MPKFCSHCGSPLNVGTRFCANCGAPVAEAEAPQNPAPERPQQPYQQPQAQPQQPQQPKQRVPIDTDPDVKSQGVDWNQFKPKLTFGKLEVSFINKRTLIIAAVIAFTALLLSLCQGCSAFKGIGGSTTTPKRAKTAKVTVKKPTNSSASTTLLTNTGTSGVKSFTLSDVDSKTLSREETRELDNLAREIKGMGNCQVTVIGHADNTGMAEVNQTVSVNRARMVADYLKKKGVTNITTSGESYNHPVASNDTAAGRAKNRRVEIFVSTVGKYNPYK